MWMVWATWVFAKQPSLERTRFLFSFMILWTIAGSFLAIYFASAGPAFYSKLGMSPDPYLPLMTYLHEVDKFLPVWALDVQDTLWQGYNGRTIVDGISAMPSMHNATALLFVLAGRQFGKRAYRLLVAHMILIFIGSVHLAWHYAIDAYLAWAVTLMVWYLAGPLAHWWHRRPETAELSAAVSALQTRR